jgi:hypothetical protein
MTLWWNVVHFFVECRDALREDDQATIEQRREEASLRQQRWLDTLASPRA